MKKLFTFLAATLLSASSMAQSPHLRLYAVDSAFNNVITPFYLSQVGISGYAKNLIYFGTTSQYVRGDGSLATFPSGYTFSGLSTQYTKGDGTYALFPTLVSSFTNDVPYLASAPATPNISKSANYTVVNGDFGIAKVLNVQVSGTSTITLPSASLFSGYTVNVTNASTGVITISGCSYDNIMSIQNSSKSFLSNGTSWQQN